MNSLMFLGTLHPEEIFKPKFTIEFSVLNSLVALVMKQQQNLGYRIINGCNQNNGLKKKFNSCFNFGKIAMKVICLHKQRWQAQLDEWTH